MFFSAPLTKLRAPEKGARLLNALCKQHAHKSSARGDARLTAKRAIGSGSARCGGCSASYRRASWTRSARVRAATRDARMRRREFRAGTDKPFARSRTAHRLPPIPPPPTRRRARARRHRRQRQHGVDHHRTQGTPREPHAQSARPTHGGRSFFFPKSAFSSPSLPALRMFVFATARDPLTKAHASPIRPSRAPGDRTGARVVHPRRPRADGGRRGPGRVRGG